jgi:ABC-type nitrate/sulfonate/bicarbonate transport system substrate-binding protein
VAIGPVRRVDRVNERRRIFALCFETAQLARTADCYDRNMHTKERERDWAGTPTRRQVLLAGGAVVALPAVAAVSRAPERASLRIGAVPSVDAGLLSGNAMASAFEDAGVIVLPVPLASYGSLLDHLAVGPKAGGIDGGIMPARLAERLAGDQGIVVIGRLGAGRLMLLERSADASTNPSGGRLMAATSEAHMEVARRRWPSLEILLLPPAQIAANLQAGTIYLALLPERVAQGLVGRGIGRAAARIFESSLKPTLVLQRECIAAHPSAASTFRDAGMSE